MCKVTLTSPETCVGLALGCFFSYIVAVSFIDGGNWSTRWKPMTCHKSLTNLSHVVSSTPCHEWGSNAQL